MHITDKISKHKWKRIHFCIGNIDGEYSLQTILSSTDIMCTLSFTLTMFLYIKCRMYMSVVIQDIF